MNKRTLKALKKSIAHWDAIAKGEEVSDGPDNCALCGLFFYKKDCIGCPVSDATGKSCCRGTPFEKFAYASSRTKEGAGHHTLIDPPKHKRLVRLALAERDFLISLLPEAKCP